MPAWELGQADPFLVEALDARRIRGAGRALDVGCRTGDNAIELAGRGFQLTAIDIADRPLALMRQPLPVPGGAPAGPTDADIRLVATKVKGSVTRTPA